MPVMFAIAAVLAFSLMGCSAGTASFAASNAPSSPGSATSSASLFTPDDWPHNETTEGLPDPAFSVPANSTTVSDRNVKADWTGVPENEVIAYVDELKKADFTYEASEKKSADQYFYSAHNDEEVTKSIMVTVAYSNDGALSITATNWKVS